MTLKTYNVAVSSTCTEYTQVKATSAEAAAEHPAVNFPSTCHQCPETSGEAFAIYVYGDREKVMVFDEFEAQRQRLKRAIEILERGADLTNPDLERSPEGLIRDALAVLKGEQ